MGSAATEIVDAAVAILEEAYRTKEPVAPLTETFGGLDVVTAYEIQLAHTRRRIDAGATIRGHKVGLTSAAMQQQLGVDQPDYGHLLDDMFVESGRPVPPGQLLQPRVEPEVAFVLQHELAGPDVTVADALRAVEFVVPALEVVDSRIRDWKITLADTIADNASSGAVVLGGKPTQLGAVDLRLVGCNLYRNGAIVCTGAGGAVLGDPVHALVWLANTLGRFGVTLQPGHVVLPGACTASVPVAPGDTVTAVFATLGSVSVTFGREAA